MIRAGPAKPLGVRHLAEAAGMGRPTFHGHFRAITSLTPLQFQRHLRLIEARRRLLSEGATVGHAAFAVGYESLPQFTREYGRMFGLSPARDIGTVKVQVRSAA